MMQRWQKHGLILEPRYGKKWWVSHGMCPVAEYREGDIFRIYFSGRDEFNRSLIGCADIRLPSGEVLYVSEAPILGLGELGCFDDNGVTPSWIVEVEKEKYLYYIGWNPRSTVRMKLFAGLAISSDGGETFKRHARVPVLDRTDGEPFINTAPCVLQDNGLFRCWYVCGTEWMNPDLPRYHIRYAESEDGKTWRRDGHVCIDYAEGESALARPCVIKDHDRYRMWYSFKNNTYRIGYAESADGFVWTRMDHKVGLNVSKTGWDSEMIEYSYVFDHKKKRYMLYCGNDYGRAGIGLASLEER